MRISCRFIVSLVLLSLLALLVPGSGAAAAATIYVPDNYSTIQSAVNAATSGDTIIVRNGIYTENVYVDKSLTIQSDNGADYTTVRGANPQNHVFYIAANNVNISGFTVEGATGSGTCGMSCDYPGCYSGIYLDSVTGCSISSNRILNNYFGIYLSNSQGSDITDNDFLFNSRGINVHSSSRNTIANNRIYYSGWVIYRSGGGTSSINGSGISFFSSSSENEIANNVFSRNNHHDISSSSNSKDNIFYQNNFVDGKNYNISFDQDTTGVLNSTKEIAYTYNGNTYTSYLGNYYVDYHTNYEGSDADSDGIGDRPYDINWNNPYKGPHYDNYPLMGPFEDAEIGSTPASRPPARTDYTLTIQVKGSGSAIPEIGAHDYREGGRVEITATPDSGWELDSWSGDVADSGSAITCVRMFTDKTIAANFFESSPISTPPPSGLADSAWPMFRHDLQHTGRSPYSGPAAPQLKWSYTSKGASFSSAAIGADGTIYIASWSGNLYAIEPGGSLKWRYTAGSYVHSPPAVGADGTIYVGSYDNKLYAINPDGSLNWTYDTGGDVTSSCSIGPDGTIYVGSWDHKLYAINPGGSLKWSYTTGDYIDSSPAIGTDGTIYVGSADDRLYAINRDGSLKWSYTAGGLMYSPAIGADGTVYVGSYDGKLYAINPDGSLKWSYTTGSGIWSSPAIGADGTIYIGSFDNKLYAINTDGSLKWSYTTGDKIYSSPAIGADGTIYVGSYDNKLYAINPDGSLKWSCTTEDSVSSSPAVGADGTIYVASMYSRLYAIGDNEDEFPSALHLAAATIAEEKSKGFNVAAAEDMLARAQRCLEEADYACAFELASMATRLAEDIDQDGVVNDRDFAPTIKNIYIYIGAPILILCLAIAASVVVMSRLRRRRFARIIEKEKAELIDMIDEALEKTKHE